MSVCDEEIVNWKKLWQLTSGTHYDVPLEVVKSQLFEVTSELQSGILYYKKCATSNADLEKFLKSKKQEKLLSFASKLQQILDLENNQLWSILCFYLLNEYRGSAYSLIQYISIENVSKLLDDIWGYYSMERITLLKIVKNLLEFCNNTQHPYSNAYKFIINNINIKKLRKSYIEQFEYLINENSLQQNLIKIEFYNYQQRLMSWSERKMREMIEIIQIIILCINYDGIDPKELHKLFICFRLHGFGLQQQYIDYKNNEYHRELTKKITYNEIVLIMRCLDVLQKNPVDGPWIVEVIKYLDVPILQLQSNQEYGPIFLSWMLFNYQIDTVLEDENAMKKYRQFGIKAVKLNIFVFLKEILQHQMFQTNSSIAKIVRETIYNHLSYLCDLFNDDGSISQYDGVYELFSELISWPHIATEFCDNTNSGAHSLYKQALEYFPINFIHFSDIAYSLIKSRKSDFINSELSNLKIFATYYNDRNFHLKPSNDNDNEFQLINNYYPFVNKDLFKIPELTNAIISRDIKNNQQQQQQIVHFYLSGYNYFNVLQNEIDLLLNETHTNDELNELRLKRLHSGINLLSLYIRNIETISELSNEIVQPIEMCIDILYKFKELQEPPIKLFSLCLNVLTNLLTIFPDEILIRVINLKILPLIKNKNLDYIKYANGIGYDSSLIGSYLINIENKLGKYDFLLSYLNFIREYLKLKRDETEKLELSGLIFVLHEILPHIHSWQFQDLNDKNRILIEILKFVCEILDETTEYSMHNLESKNQIKEMIKNKLILRNICLYNLLNLENGTVLLRFIAVGNAFLQTIMENDTNWIQKTNDITLLVRLSMKILMHTLKLKSTIYNDNTSLSPLEMLIYTQPKKQNVLNIIPMITSYMNNIFDKWLPILSCRLLRRIALEFNLSLLACLDMEPEHVRLIFLQRLPDNLENIDLKCAILEFIEACISKQPGLTEAFFRIKLKSINLDYKKDDKGDTDDEKKTKDGQEFLKSLVTTTESNDNTNENSNNINDYSILTFMNDYLINVSKNPYIIENPLYSRIMSIYHALWRKNMQILGRNLISKKNFWSSICNPLFCDELNTKDRAYSQLFSILTLELFSLYDYNRKSRKNLTSNDDFKRIINKFFNKITFNKWIKHIFDIPTTKLLLNNESNISLYKIDETPDWLILLQSFKEFCIITLNKNNLSNDYQIPYDNLKYLENQCLNALNKCVLNNDNNTTELIQIDIRSFITLSELYLHILINIEISYTVDDDINDNRTMLEDIVKLLLNLIPIYDSLQFRAIESILSILMRLIDIYADDITKNYDIGLNLVQLIIDIITIELHKFEKYIQDELKEQQQQQQQRQKKRVTTDIENDEQFNPKSFILSLNLLKTIMYVSKNETTIKFCENTTIKTNKIILCLLNCTNIIIQNFTKTKLTNELLDVLIIFAKNDCCINEFFNYSISDYLWLKLIPPKELLMLQTSFYTLPSSYQINDYDKDYNSTELTYNELKNLQIQKFKNLNWTAQDWWPIYQKGIELITIILQYYKINFLNDIFTFIGIHEEYLIDSLLLGKQSLEINSIQLIKTTLYFLTECFLYHKEWKLKHSQSLFNLMKTVQILMDHSISLLYQPKILKQFVEKDNLVQQQQCEPTEQQSQEMLADSLIRPTNDLIEIIVLSTKCLLNFSPTLLELICEPEFLPSKWESLIGIQFGAPKFNVTATTSGTSHHQLTFGKILSAVAILIKGLNLQSYEFHEIPMNMIPQAKNKKSRQSNNVVNSNKSLPSSQQFTTHSDSTTHHDRSSAKRNSRSPLKSISITSTVNLSSVSNEILSNLDSDLCLNALEYILTLTASQFLLSLKNVLLSNREKQLIRREINNELALFYDFVRRKLYIDLRDHRNIWQRKKHGIVMMMDLKGNNNDDDDGDDNDNSKGIKETIQSKQPGPSREPKISPSSSTTAKDSMRINVVRRQHLNKQQQSKTKDVSLDISQPMSPISLTKSKKSSEKIRKPVISSTPVASKLTLTRKNDSDIEIEKRLRTDAESTDDGGGGGGGGGYDDDEEYILFFPNEEPLYNPLSYIQFVEEDYLHFLSNLFHVICSVD